MKNPKALAAAAMTGAIGAGALFGAALGNPLASGAQDDATSTAPADTEARTEDGPRGPGHRGGPDLEAASEVLGLTAEELRAELADGKTLAEVAEARGVDRQALIDALVAAGEARLDEMRENLPERVAELVDRTLPARGEGGRGGNGPGFGRGGPGLEAAADALGMEVDALHEAIRDGQTLAEVAEAQGVEVQAVIDALVAEATERIAQKAEGGRLTQEQADERIAELTERITQMVNEGRPERGGRPGGDAPDGD